MIENNITAIVIVLGAVLVIAVVLMAYLFLRIRRTEGEYYLLTRGTQGKNIVEIVGENIEQVESLLREVDYLSERYAALLRRMAGAVQHVGVVRYDAFRDLGGLLSFSVALLDDRGNGLVMSSIYGRSDSRTYAKPIVERGSTYELSPEEREAIRLAMQSREMGALPVEARNQEHEERISTLRLFHEREKVERSRREPEPRIQRRPERTGSERRASSGTERRRPAPGLEGERHRRTGGRGSRGYRDRERELMARSLGRDGVELFDREEHIEPPDRPGGSGGGLDSDGEKETRQRRPADRSRRLDTPVERLRRGEPGGE